MVPSCCILLLTSWYVLGDAATRTGTTATPRPRGRLLSPPGTATCATTITTMTKTTSKTWPQTHNCYCYFATTEYLTRNENIKPPRSHHIVKPGTTPTPLMKNDFFGILEQTASSGGAWRKSPDRARYSWSIHRHMMLQTTICRPTALCGSLPQERHADSAVRNSARVPSKEWQ